MCGKDALDYVRYRHTDNDLIRGARQQDFIRQLLRGRGVRKKLSFAKRITLAKIAGSYTRTDEALRSKSADRLAAQARARRRGQAGPAGHVRRRPHPGRRRLPGRAPTTRIDETLDAVHEPEDGHRGRPRRSPSGRPPSVTKHRRKKQQEAGGPRSRPAWSTSRPAGENEAIAAKRRLRFPFYYPKLGPSPGATSTPRRASTGSRPTTATTRPTAWSSRSAWPGEYYGVQGMTWKSPCVGRPAGPPILDGPHDTLERNGRELHVYYDGKKVRLVSLADQARRLLRLQHADARPVVRPHRRHRRIADASSARD